LQNAIYLVRINFAQLKTTKAAFQSGTFYCHHLVIINGPDAYSEGMILQKAQG
jgi:hypothetical protein